MSFKEYEPFDLAKSPFYIHELQGYEIDNILNVFCGFVEKVVGRINDGKEATVYLCSPDPESLAQGRIDHQFLAAKMYKANKFRSFENDRSYRNLNKIKDRRMAKAMRNKSSRGQKAFRNHWIDSEWRYLNQLYDAGVQCPKPYSHYDDGVLMSCSMDQQGPAPRLVDCRLTDEQAKNLLGGILDDVTTMLQEDIVHGDLSAYNILYDGQTHCIIDVPQAVDIRTSANASELLWRDLVNLGKYFSRYDLEIPIESFMGSLYR